MKRTGPHLLDVFPPQKSYDKFNANFQLLFFYFSQKLLHEESMSKDLPWGWFEKFSVLFFSIAQKCRTDLTHSNYSSLICLPGPLLFAVLAAWDPAQVSFSLSQKLIGTCVYIWVLFPFSFFFLSFSVFFLSFIFSLIPGSFFSTDFLSFFH